MTDEANAVVERLRQVSSVLFDDYGDGTHAIAAIIGATPADIPGLWNAPGYPELTTAQMIQAARQAEGTHDAG